MMEAPYIVTGVQYIDGSPQYAGVAKVIHACSEQEAVSKFEEVETGSEEIWIITAQID